MKKLILVRHAKAKNVLIGEDDYIRALTKRGVEDAGIMAERLKQQGVVPDYWISSPAERACHTAKIFAGKFNAPLQDIHFGEKIYEANTSDLLHLINDFPDSASQAILFGHNPSLILIVDYLCNRDIVHLPTSGTIQIEFPFDSWASISKNTGHLVNQLIN